MTLFPRFAANEQKKGDSTPPSSFLVVVATVSAPPCPSLHIHRERDPLNGFLLFRLGGYLGLEAIPNVLLIVPLIPSLEGRLCLVEYVLVEEDWQCQHDGDANKSPCVGVVQHRRPEGKGHDVRGGGRRVVYDILRFSLRVLA